MLNKDVFNDLCRKFGCPDIDLFASRNNHQLPLYMSWFPDCHAYAIDAFSHVWNKYVYIFPPFNHISRILRKLREDKTPKAIMIVPMWKVAHWYPTLQKMSVIQPIRLTQSKTLLQLSSDPKAVHPLHPKLQMMACILCGQN